MADPKGPETGKDAKGAPSARPRSPTLDLSATDVTAKSTPASSPGPDKPAEAPKAADAPKPSDAPKPADKAAADAPVRPDQPAAAAARSASESSKAGAANTQTSVPGAAAPKPEAAKPQTPKPEAATEQPKPSAAPTGAARPTATVQPDRPAREGVGVAGLFFAAIAGAALALGGVALFGKQLIGAIDPDQSRVQAVEQKLDSVGGDLAALRADLAKIKPTDTSPIEARLAELSKAAEAAGGRVGSVETALKSLSEQVAKPPAQDPAIPVLSGRVDGLELRFQNAPSPEELAVLVGRLDGVEARFKELPAKEALADLSVRVDDLGETVDGVGQKIGAATAPLNSRVDQLANALKERPKGDPNARLVVALGALDQALQEGRPFASELGAAKAANGDSAELGALDAHAAAGLPTREALGAELSGEIAKLAPVKPAAEGSVFDRFVASAGAVVKVTPKDAASGSDPAAVRARVAQLGAAGDLEGALGARGSLDEAARAATDGWAERASARVAAEKAIGSARTAALARLTSND